MPLTTRRTSDVEDVTANSGMAAPRFIVDPADLTAPGWSGLRTKSPHIRLERASQSHRLTANDRKITVSKEQSRHTKTRCYEVLSGTMAVAAVYVPFRICSTSKRSVGGLRVRRRRSSSVWQLAKARPPDLDVETFAIDDAAAVRTLHEQCDRRPGREHPIGECSFA